MKDEKKATRQSYGEALREVGMKNKDIVVLDADLAGATKSDIFKKEFPDRFFDMGISEQDMITTAAGMASCGKIPFASTFAVFAAGRAYDQIRNSICYPNLNVKICGSHAGVTVGEDGATHQMLEDINLMKGLPNMKVFSPSDDVQTKWIVEEMLNIQGPCYIRTARLASNIIYDDGEKFDGKKSVQFGEGTDATVFATGICVSEALKAQVELEKAGINIRVIDMFSLKPIDEEVIVKAAKETKKLISVEDHNIIGGLGSIIADVLVQKYPAKLLKMGIHDRFGESGKAIELLGKFQIDCNAIVNKVKEE
ncbi:MAG: transketolase family protein [Clostridia bacterium]|nr:transketolase family protein [Clostridia bacterium]